MSYEIKKTKTRDLFSAEFCALRLSKKCNEK